MCTITGNQYNVIIIYYVREALSVIQSVPTTYFNFTLSTCLFPPRPLLLRVSDTFHFYNPRFTPPPNDGTSPLKLRSTNLKVFYIKHTNNNDIHNQPSELLCLRKVDDSCSLCFLPKHDGIGSTTTTTTTTTTALLNN